MRLPPAPADATQACGLHVVGLATLLQTWWPRLAGDHPHPATLPTSSMSGLLNSIDTGIPLGLFTIAEVNGADTLIDGTARLSALHAMFVQAPDPTAWPSKAFRFADRHVASGRPRFALLHPSDQTPQGFPVQLTFSHPLHTLEWARKLPTTLGGDPAMADELLAEAQAFTARARATTVAVHRLPHRDLAGVRQAMHRSMR